MNKDSLTSLVPVLTPLIYFSGPVLARTNSTRLKRSAESELPYCISDLSNKTIDNSLSKNYLSYLLSIGLFS